MNSEKVSDERFSLWQKAFLFLGVIILSSATVLRKKNAHIESYVIMKLPHTKTTKAFIALFL